MILLLRVPKKHYITSISVAIVILKQGFTEALFATTVFHLRLSLKCSWGLEGAATFDQNL